MIGLLADRMVLRAWTPRDDTRRIISMSTANTRERTLYERRFR